MKLIEVRNMRQSKISEHAILLKTLVYRGLPSPQNDGKSNALNLSQADFWETFKGVEVTHRLLKYTNQNAQNNRIIVKKQEKGIDVLCALALVREARTSDLVILASQDTDLVPAIEEAIALKQAKIETFSWYSTSSRRSFELRSPVAPTWNTRLGEEEYFQCLDENTYGV